MKTQEQDELRAFHLSALHAVTGYDYLTRKWQPREGPLFVALIRALRSHCYYNRETGEVRTSCFPSLQTIADECGVSRRTVCRLLQRDKDGVFINRSLERFIRVIPRKRYDAKGQRQVQTSNLYMVCMDDPCTPEDDYLVELKERELEEAMRHTSECQSGTLKGVSDCHPQSSAKTAQEISSSKVVTTNPVSFDLHERLVESGQRNTPFERYEEMRYESSERVGPRTNRVESSKGSEDQFRRSSHLSKEKMVLNEEQEAASSVIYSLLQEYGDENAGIGSKIILKALIDAHAPDEKLIDLAYLGRARLRRFQMRGGHVENKAGYFVNLMRSLAKEAKRRHWDVEQIEEEDKKQHEKAVKRSKQPRNGGTYHYA
jgi:hypothetical protein